MYKTDNRLIEAPEDTIIWRYLSFTSFYLMLLNQSLFFRRLDKYSDQLEGTLHDKTIAELYESKRKFVWHDAEAKKMAENELANIISYKAHSLSNSWTINDDEDYAMWKIYLQTRAEGVGIKSTVGRLKKCLMENTDFEFFSGKISYEVPLYKDINVFSVTTNKRNAYSYEKEYRALMLLQFSISKENDKQIRVPKFEIGAEVKIKIEELVDEIYISPFCESWFRPVIDSTINYLLPNFDLKKIRQSGIKEK